MRPVPLVNDNMNLQTLIESPNLELGAGSVQPTRPFGSMSFIASFIDPASQPPRYEEQARIYAPDALPNGSREDQIRDGYSSSLGRRYDL